MWWTMPSPRGLRSRYPRSRHREDRSRPLHRLPVRLCGRVDERPARCARTSRSPSCRFGSEQSWEVPGAEAAPVTDETGPIDQSRLVANLVAASTAASIPPPRRPWLDELAAARPHQAPPAHRHRARGRCHRHARAAAAGTRCSSGPNTDGNIAVFGAGGSGKTAALRTPRGVRRYHPPRRSGRRLRARLRHRQPADARGAPARRLGRAATTPTA